MTHRKDLTGGSRRRRSQQISAFHVKQGSVLAPLVHIHLMCRRAGGAPIARSFLICAPLGKSFRGHSSDPREEHAARFHVKHVEIRRRAVVYAFPERRWILPTGRLLLRTVRRGGVDCHAPVVRGGYSLNHLETYPKMTVAPLDQSGATVSRETRSYGCTSGFRTSAS